MATRQNRRTAITRSMLRHSLMELMQDKPFSQITIKELCDRADLNRTTFYLHYHSQEELLADIEDEISRQTSELIRNIQTGDEQVSDLTLLLEYIRENETVFRTLLCNNQNGEFRETFLSHILTNIKKHSKTRGTAKQSPYIHAFITSGCLEIIVTWITNDFDMPAGKLADLIHSLCKGAGLEYPVKG